MFDAIAREGWFFWRVAVNVLAVSCSFGFSWLLPSMQFYICFPILLWIWLFHVQVSYAFLQRGSIPYALCLGRGHDLVEIVSFPPMPEAETPGRLLRVKSHVGWYPRLLVRSRPHRDGEKVFMVRNNDLIEQTPDSSSVSPATTNTTTTTTRASPPDFRHMRLGWVRRTFQGLLFLEEVTIDQITGHLRRYRPPTAVSSAAVDNSNIPKNSTMNAIAAVNRGRQLRNLHNQQLQNKQQNQQQQQQQKHSHEKKKNNNNGVNDDDNDNNAGGMQNGAARSDSSVGADSSMSRENSPQSSDDRHQHRHDDVGPPPTTHLTMMMPKRAPSAEELVLRFCFGGEAADED